MNNLVSVALKVLLNFGFHFCKRVERRGSDALQLKKPFDAAQSRTRVHSCHKDARRFVRHSPKLADQVFRFQFQIGPRCRDAGNRYGHVRRQIDGRFDFPHASHFDLACVSGAQ